MSEEEWKIIEEFPDYLVSRSGLVKDSLTGVMRNTYDSDGALSVSLKHRDGRLVKRLVHRLVASAFVPGEDEELQINHIDGNRTNNTPTNLEWVTQEENIEHAIRIGRIKKYDKDEGYFEGW